MEFNTTQDLEFPILIFSDLHWGQKANLEIMALNELKNIITKNGVNTVISAGDLINIHLTRDILRKVENLDAEPEEFRRKKRKDDAKNQLLEELNHISSNLGYKLHIIAGNHDPKELYQLIENNETKKYLNLGWIYRNDKLFIAHGHQFWNVMKMPLNIALRDFRKEYSLDNEIIVLGHRHKVFNYPNLNFYSNGSIGRGFSVVIIKENYEISLQTIPIFVELDVDALVFQYKDAVNKDELIDEFINSNVKKIESTELVTDLLNKEFDDKTSFFLIEEGKILGMILGKKLNNLKQNTGIDQLKELRVIEISSSIAYEFIPGQTLKEAWAVFSASGETILPVIDPESNNELIGKLSIFSVPKSEKAHIETKQVDVDEGMESLADKLFGRMLGDEEN